MRSSILAAGLLAVSAATPLPAKAVVGPSTPGSVLERSIVMVLQRQGATAGFCTAIVVSPVAVLTAAHCVPPGADLRVHFAEAGSPRPVLLPVSAVALHPDYRPDAIRRRERSVDLALVRLAAPLPARFVPVTLAPTVTGAAGQRFVVSGFGLAQEGEAASSGQLRSATLAAREPLSSLLLWATDPAHQGAGACTGDSGAPVALPDASGVAAMVVWSAGTGRHRCGDLTQALWLAPYRSWIDGIVAGWIEHR